MGRSLVSALERSLLDHDHVSFRGETAKLVQVLGHEVHVVGNLFGHLFNSNALLGHRLYLGNATLINLGAITCGSRLVTRAFAGLIEATLVLSGTGAVHLGRVHA